MSRQRGSTAGAIVATGLISLLTYGAVFRRLAGRSVVALLVASIGVGFLLRAVLGVVFGHAQQVFQVPLSRPYLLGGIRVMPLDLQLAANRVGRAKQILKDSPPRLVVSGSD